MKVITEEIKHILKGKYTGAITKALKWTDIYDNEEELINDLKSIKIYYNICNNTQITKGYNYLLSFQKQLSQGKKLSDKQVTQLKRLAWSIALEKYCRKNNGYIF